MLATSVSFQSTVCQLVWWSSYVFPFFIVGQLVPAACLIGMGYVGCDYTLAVTLLCIAGLFDGVSQSGYSVNQLDIAPKYAGKAKVAC